MQSILLLLCHVKNKKAPQMWPAPATMRMMGIENTNFYIKQFKQDIHQIQIIKIKLLDSTAKPVRGIL